MADKAKERIGLPIYGRIREDIFKRLPDGREVLLERRPWRRNKIVDSAGQLLAGLLANYVGFTGGILYHAIGQGNAGWGVSPPDPGDGDTTLYDEVFRKQPATIVFVQEVEGQADSGTYDTIVDAARTEADDYWNGMMITVTAGTNAGLSRLIKDFQNSSGTITVDEPFPAPIDSSSEYEIDEPVTVPPFTDKIEVKTVFSFGDGPDGFDMREQGLFGGTATATLDSGIMINALRHPPMYKDHTIKIVRYIQLDFVRTT